MDDNQNADAGAEVLDIPAVEQSEAAEAPAETPEAKAAETETAAEPEQADAADETEEDADDDQPKRKRPSGSKRLKLRIAELEAQLAAAGTPGRERAAHHGRRRGVRYPTCAAGRVRPARGHARGPG